VPQSNGIQFSVRLPNLKSGGFPSLDFIQNAVVDVLQRWSDNLAEAIAVFAYDVNARFQSSLLGSGEESRRLGAEEFIGSV